MTLPTLFPLAAQAVRKARIAGLMCGTSVDSIDVAVCDITQLPDAPRYQVELVGFHEVAVNPALKARIFEVFKDGDKSLSLCCSLNAEIAKAFSDAYHAALAALDIAHESVDCIASHGQTVWHVAPHQACAERVPSTLQIGDPCMLAHHARTPVVANFRTADMAAGGNGAPLVPFADWHLFGSAGKTTLILNIGGIANITVLPADDVPAHTVAFDTGPGNMIIDALVTHFTGGRQTFDYNGAIAATGQINEQILAQWMAVPYIGLPYPKSTGRELFGAQFTHTAITEFPAVSYADFVATATMFTARSVAANLRDFLCDTSVLAVAGGGALNPILMKFLQAELRRVSGCYVRVCRLEEVYPFTAKARECTAFAILGFATLCGTPGNIPTATGASQPKILGCVAFP